MAGMTSPITFNFAGKHALITGGGQGIGFEIARQFLQTGARVTIWEASDRSLDHAKSELAAHAQLLSLQKVDVSNRSLLVPAVKGFTQPLDILINNAGITRDKSFKKMTDEDFDQVINVNLTGVFNVTKACLDHFNGSSVHNRIVNLASVVALYGNFGQTNYVAAKSAVIGMTKTWAKELGRKGFTVNAIAPGFIATPMTQAMPAEVLKSIQDKVPVGRMGSTLDIAQACLFLASESASYINGTTLSVDGGVTL